mmetsp:Transcript_41333/g.125099  ORF Transcript_41333/g.125099 Transcript_41333/m.125099 type:complete len:591 (-) Transcript_41333:111-1883(-)|eukprot:CAMPEP_0113567664 /NCGR_PEP_ID=MMETSP0015_2-20120614/23403_1 /TAXON_ID=2838 /ORGANISM="Odontella" /LENGTH=590 /DNA_ID=CAMNT_0000470087 /DNA_START=113 /DNA_END=1885 /DNA_ORIENTATION=- /assembly_acc=CAM_ASM_000160
MSPLRLLKVLLLMSNLSTSASMVNAAPNAKMVPPIVYSIAGSDSGGGAGIQADLHAIHSMGCHGCSAITALTAQNSCGVTGVHSPPVEFLRQQLNTLMEDLPPRAIKIGMLGSKDLAVEVGNFLKVVKKEASDNEPVFVIFDPVMISTSGHKLIDDDAISAIMEHVFPHADVLTPNKFEAEALLRRELKTPEDIENGARELLTMGVKSVLIKGGHSLAESKQRTAVSPDANATIGYAQDYFLSSEGPLQAGEERLCDGCRGVWIRSDRYDSPNTHGTGCTLSSAIASALAIGHKQRATVSDQTGTGAARAILPVDACCLAKAYVTAGIGRGVQLGSGPGPVVHTGFPSSFRHFPSIVSDPKVRTSDVVAFTRMQSPLSPPKESVPVLGKILPIVDTVSWIERLAKVKGITDLQLRIKSESSPEKILDAVKKAQAACNEFGVRLWINDHWEAAIAAKCFGVHLGQEDLAKCADCGGLEKIKENRMALGISTHSYAELAAALGVKPSYISLGPVFGTLSKNVAFDPQGLATVYKWRDLIDPCVPLVAIGGISNPSLAKKVKNAGADCVAVIGAITNADDESNAVQELLGAMN